MHMTLEILRSLLSVLMVGFIALPVIVWHRRLAKLAQHAERSVLHHRTADMLVEAVGGWIEAEQLCVDTLGDENTDLYIRASRLARSAAEALRAAYAAHQEAISLGPVTPAPAPGSDGYGIFADRPQPTKIDRLYYELGVDQTQMETALREAGFITEFDIGLGVFSRKGVFLRHVADPVAWLERGVVTEFDIGHAWRFGSL